MKNLLQIFAVLLTSLCFGQVEGDIIITEIMPNPSAVSDNLGEYFEIYNSSSSAIDIDGWVIRDNVNSHSIDNGGPLTIGPGEYLVLSLNGDVATNGGIDVDYVYPSSLALANSGDQVSIETSGALVIDIVVYSSSFPFASGVSMSLVSLDASDNDDSSNWIASTLSYGDGDLGTPGKENFPPATVTWTGSTDAKWSTPSNWDTNEVPVMEENVVIPDVPNDPLIEAGEVAEVNDIIIHASASLSVQSGGSLAIFGDATVDGSFAIERNMTGGDGTTNSAGYSIGGVPVMDGEIQDFDAQFIYSYVNPSGFTSNLNGSPESAAPGTGFFVGYDAVSPSITFVGTPNTGDVSYAVTQTSGFELVANPYTAAIITSEFLADNSAVITGGVYFWDDGGSNVGEFRGGDYIAVNSMGSAAAVQPNGVDDGVAGNTGTSAAENGFIPSIQGVFVEVQGAGDITFSPSQISTSSTANSDANHYRKIDYQKVKLAMVGNGNYNEVLVGLGEDATLQRDYLDARKFETDNPLSFYSLIGDEKFVIQGIPFVADEAIRVPLGFDLINGGQYQLKVIAMENMSSNLAITLKDHTTGEVYLLDENFVLDFASQPVKGDQRFELIFGGEEALNVAESLDHLKIIGDKEGLLIEYPAEGIKPVVIYDLSGKIIWHGKAGFANNSAFIDAELERDKLLILRLGNESVKFILD